MNELMQKSYAKINLCLSVLQRLPNGYHRISSLMQRVGLYDIVTLRPTLSQITVETNWAELNEELEENTAKKAAELFFRQSRIRAGAKIFLEKNIPHQAGLGGSSSNAACVIEGLDKLFDTNLSYEKKCELALQVGADVPFFIKGGTAKVEGIGEQITPLTPALSKDVLIIKPAFNVSTKTAYAGLVPSMFEKQSDPENLYEAYLHDDLNKISEYTINTFEKNIQQHQEILQIKRRCYESGAIASLMSGSGSAVFAVFSSREMCYNAYQKLSSEYERIFLTEFY